MHNLVVRHKSFVNTITQLNLSHTFFCELIPEPIDLFLVHTNALGNRERVPIKLLVGNKEVILFNTQNNAHLDLEDTVEGLEEILEATCKEKVPNLAHKAVVLFLFDIGGKDGNNRRNSEMERAQLAFLVVLPDTRAYPLEHFITQENQLSEAIKAFIKPILKELFCNVAKDAEG